MNVQVFSPASGELVGECAVTTPEQISSAIRDAEQAFDAGIWSRQSPVDRATVLNRIAAALTKELPRLALLESRQTGRPLREMSTQLQRLPEWFEYFASVVRTEEGLVAPTKGSLLNFVKREPLGVVALITSFNHPLLICVKKLSVALAAGNSVIVKPSELAPLSVLELCKIAREAGLPQGVLHVLVGDSEVGRAIVSHSSIRKVDLTGGTSSGRAIGETVGRNLTSFTAELGGKAPVICFDDINIDVCVNGCAFAAWIASGQTCVAGTRAIVHKTIYDAFLEKLVAKAESIRRRMGDPLNPKSVMGPVISQKQLSLIENLVTSARDQGARIVFGGKRMSGLSELDGWDLSKGFFYEPTIVVSGSSVPIEDTRLWREEAFGPVLVVTTFETEAEAIALANDSQYGLGAAIWTRNGGQVLRVADKLQHGIIWQNTHHRNDPSSVWGGFKDSGIGRENGREAYMSYTQSKSVIINYATEESALASEDWFKEDAGDVRYG